MKNYEEMSDFEINNNVAKALGLDIKEYQDRSGSMVWFTVKNKEGNDYFDYIDYKDFCNKPEDAWPIITENKISIMFDSTDTRYEGGYYEWCDAISSCQKFGIQHQSNPLRAAMIVFLKMNEDKL